MKKLNIKLKKRNAFLRSSFLVASLLVSICIPDVAIAESENKLLVYTPELKSNNAISDLPSTLTTLTPRTAEAADLMKVRPYVDLLLQMRRDGQTRPGLADKKVAAIKLTVYRKMMLGVLEVRYCTARIDRELAYAYDVEAGVTGRRNKLVARTNTINFLQFGILGATRTGLLMNSHPSHAILDTSNYIRSTTSGIGLFLSGLTFAEMRTGHRRIDTEPNSLAGVFSIESARPVYLPGVVWKFLTAVPPDAKDGVSRRDILLKQWRALRQLDVANKPRIQQISAAPQTESEYTESIRVLNDRIFMLHDLHAMIEQLDFELYELQKLTSGDSTPPGIAPYGVVDAETNGPVTDGTTTSVHGATIDRTDKKIETEQRITK